MIFLNKNYPILGILVIIGLIVAISGCTTQTIDPTKDLVPNDEFGIGGPSPFNEWYINGFFHSVSGTGYSQVAIHLIAYNSKNQSVGQKDIVVYDIKPGKSRYFDVTIKTNGTVDHVSFVAVNATKT